MEFMGSFQELNQSDEMNIVNAITEEDVKMESEDLIKPYSDLLDSISERTSKNLPIVSKISSRVLTSQVITSFIYSHIL